LPALTTGSQRSLLVRKTFLSQSVKRYLHLEPFRWKDGKVIYAKNSHWHRSSTKFVISLTVILDLQTHAPSQGTNYDRSFADGSLLRIPPQTITSRAVLTMRELQRGSFGEIFSKSGSPLVPFFGFTANVCPIYRFPPSST
jgi:hypothetical protein